MSEIIKPIILDETGKNIVEKIEKQNDILTTLLNNNSEYKIISETTLMDADLEFRAETDLEGLNEDGTPKWYLCDNVPLKGSDLLTNKQYKLTIDNGETFVTYGKSIYSRFNGGSNSFSTSACIGDENVLGVYDESNIGFVICGKYKFNEDKVMVFTKDTKTMHHIKLVYVEVEYKEYPHELTGKNDALLIREFGDAPTSVKIGASCVAKGKGSVAIGAGTKAMEDYATAFGNGAQATNKNSFACGCLTQATGERSFAEGYMTQANGTYSHASGNTSIANGGVAYAIGQKTISNGAMAFAGGNGSESGANARTGFAYGNYVNTNYASQFAVGYGNNPLSEDVFEVGNGLNASGAPNNTGSKVPVTRQNAFRVTQAGVAVAQTGLQIGNTIISENQLQALLALLG